MAVYLTTDTDLTSVADAIRTKGGTSAQLEFPGGFVTAIGDISGGGELYYTSRMIPYQKEMTIPKIQMGVNPGLMQGATNLESVVCNDDRTLGGSNNERINQYFMGCTSLKTFEMPYVAGFLTGYTNQFLGNCTALEDAVFGSIGHPITQLKPTSGNDLLFNGCTQAGLTITLYVNASALADVPADVKTYAPWGATNATIVYRSSVDGSVLT